MMKLLSGPYGLLIKWIFVAVIAIGYTGGIFYLGNKYGSNNVQVAWDAQKLKDAENDKNLRAHYQKLLDDKQAQNDQLSKELQDALDNFHVVVKTVTHTVTKEVESNPSYETCKLPPSGPLLLNQNAQQYNKLMGAKP